MFIWGKLDRSIIILRSTVIRVTETTVELSLNYHFLTLAFHHAGLDTLSACSFIATFQVNRLFIFEIEGLLANTALEV